MSSLKLYGSTSGYVEVVPEATAGNNSVTLPNGSGTLVVGDSGGNLNISGIITASQINVGTAVTINSSGINIGVSTFYGDASGLTNVPAGSSVTGDFTITNGNVVVSNGYGIDFSATANSSGTMSSELLDDYEEGTWTPALRNGGGGAVYTQQTGRYTKIGRMVYGEIICAWSNKGTAADLSFTGLPFASSPLSQYTRGIIITAPTALTAGYTFYALEVSSVFSSSTIYAIEVKTDGTVNNLSTPSSGTFRAILIYSVS